MFYKQQQRRLLLMDESQLLARREQLLSQNYWTGYDKEQLNDINTKLRRRYNYKYVEAPNYDKRDSAKQLTVSKGFTVVGNAPSYDEQTEKTGYKIEQNLVSSQEALRADKAVREGRATTADVFGGYNPKDIPLTSENIAALRARAMQSEQVRTYKPFEPIFNRPQQVGLTTTGKPIVTLGGSSQIYTEEDAPQSSLNKSYVGTVKTYTPIVEKPRNLLQQAALATPTAPFRLQDKRPESQAEFIIKVAGAGTRTTKEVLQKTGDFGETVQQRMAILDLKTDVRPIEIRGTPQTNLLEPNQLLGTIYMRTPKKEFDSLPLRVYSNVKTFGSVLGGSVESAYTLTSMPNYIVAPASKVIDWTIGQAKKVPYVNKVLVPAATVAGEFAKQSIENPFFAYAGIRGLKVFGTTAYGILDKGDVAQSVVTEGFKGYTTGGVGGAAQGALGGFIGEKVSDKFAFFARGKPTISVTGLSTSYSTTSAQSVFISPTSTRGKFKAQYEYKPYVVTSKVAEKKRGGIIKVSTFKQELPNYPTTKRTKADKIELETMFNAPEPDIVYSSTTTVPTTATKGGVSAKYDLNAGTIVLNDGSLTTKPSLFENIKGEFRTTGKTYSFKTMNKVKATVNRRPKINPQVRIATTTFFETTKPKRASTQLTRVRYFSTRPYVPQAKTLGRLFSSKRASFTGTSSFTDSGVGNYQGTFTGGNDNFAGVFTPTNLPTFTPKSTPPKSVLGTQVQQVPKPTTRTRRKSPLKVFSQSFAPVTTTTNLMTVTKPSNAAFTMAGTIASSISPSLSQSMTVSPTISTTQTQTMTVSPTITQTITATLSPTLTQTLSRTQTQTVTPTLTVTPTITATVTPTFNMKLPRSNKLFGGKKKSKNIFKSAVKYTPTAAAAGFSIKGPKLKGRLTGLEFRGIQ